MPILRDQEVLIKDAKVYDAKVFLTWWENPELKRQGFSRALHQNLELLQARLQAQQTSFAREGLWLIEVNRKAVGELYHRVKDKEAFVMIRLNEPALQGLGYGTKAMTLLLGYLFQTHAIDGVQSEVNIHHAYAQKLYERLSFKPLGVKAKAYVDASGTLQDAITYRLDRTVWHANKG